MTATKIDADNLYDALRKYNLSKNIDHCQWVECNILSDLSVPLIIKQLVLDSVGIHYVILLVLLLP